MNMLSHPAPLVELSLLMSTGAHQLLISCCDIAEVSTVGWESAAGPATEVDVGLPNRTLNFSLAGGVHDSLSQAM